MSKTLDFNKENYRFLKRLYNKAIKENQTVIKFEGEEMLVDYVKYLLEYMEMELDKLK